MWMEADRSEEVDKAISLALSEAVSPPLAEWQANQWIVNLQVNQYELARAYSTGGTT
jgi:hypothetical protein